LDKIITLIILSSTGWLLFLNLLWYFRMGGGAGEFGDAAPSPNDFTDDTREMGEFAAFVILRNPPNLCKLDSDDDEEGSL
jgi:hypothetical protein